MHIKFFQLNVYIAIESNRKYRIEWVCVCCYSHSIGYNFNMFSVNSVLQIINSSEPKKNKKKSPLFAIGFRFFILKAILFSEVYSIVSCFFFIILLAEWHTTYVYEIKTIGFFPFSNRMESTFVFPQQTCSPASTINHWPLVWKLRGDKKKINPID